MEKSIVNIGESIAKGDIKVDPYIYKDRCACDFCPYKSVCGMDSDIPGYKYRIIEKLDDDEIICRMRETDNDDEIIHGTEESDDGRDK